MIRFCLSLALLWIPFWATAEVKKFSFRLLSEPATLDWNKAHTSVETHLLVNLMEGLVDLETTSTGIEVRPCLAESWKVSSDGRTYSFKLKKGVRWSDGKELTAEHFYYSWKRLLDPRTAASFAYILFDVVGAQEFNSKKWTDFERVGIKAKSRYEFEIRLKHRVAHWKFIPSFWVTFPLRPDVAKGPGSEWARPGKMPVVGPFVLARHELNSKFVLISNRNYHREKGNIYQIDALVIPDSSTAMTLYRTGRLDLLTDIPALDLGNLAKSPELKTFPYLKTGYLGLVASRYPMNLIGFRRAIAMAIEKEPIGKLLNGGQKPATTFVPPPLFSSSSDVGLKFDPKRAKEELKQSGVDLARVGELKVLVSNWEKPLLLAQYIQDQLKKHLGLQVTIQSFDHKTFRSQVNLQNFPMFILSWGADYPDPDNFLSVFLGNSGNNRLGWDHRRYNELVLSGRSSSSQKNRRRQYLEAERVLVEREAVVLPLFYEPNKALVKPRASGVTISPLNYLILRQVKVDS